MIDELEKVKAEIERLDTNIEKVFICGDVTRDYMLGFKNALKMLSNFIDSMQEEPVSDDLWEAAMDYAATGEVLPNGKEMISFDEEKAFIAGAEWQKQQMMKCAVEAEVMIEHRRDGIYCKLIAKSHLVEYAKLNCSDGDKVRVIIIKEE